MSEQPLKIAVLLLITCIICLGVVLCFSVKESFEKKKVEYYDKDLCYKIYPTDDHAIMVCDSLDNYIGTVSIEPELDSLLKEHNQ